MSSLSELTGAGGDNIIPGHRLSELRLLDLAEAEAEATRQYVTGIADAVAHLDEPMRELFVNRAVDTLKSSPFVFGGPWFKAWGLTAKGFFHLTYLSLRIEHPKIRANEAAGLASEAKDKAADFIYGSLGWNKKKAAIPPPPSNPSTGGQSTTGSPNPPPTAMDTPSPTPAA